MVLNAHDWADTYRKMAIISSSKRFIRSPSCQKVIGKSLLLGMDDLMTIIAEGIWGGRIIYTALNAHALIADVRPFNRQRKRTNRIADSG